MHVSPYPICGHPFELFTNWNKESMKLRMKAISHCTNVLSYYNLRTDDTAAGSTFTTPLSIYLASSGYRAIERVTQLATKSASLVKLCAWAISVAKPRGWKPSTVHTATSKWPSWPPRSLVARSSQGCDATHTVTHITLQSTSCWLVFLLIRACNWTIWWCCQ